MSQHTKHGCDHIFFIGFLGAYGLVGFIYGMIPTAIVYIIACVIRHIKTKNDLGHGQPLIPSILVSAPARIAMFLMQFHRRFFLFPFLGG